MFEIRRVAAAVAIVAIALLPVPPAAAQSQETQGTGAAAENVKLTVRLGRLADGERTEVKSYDLIVISGGVSSRLLSGERKPFPAGEGGDGGSGRIVYQNIGFSTEAHAWVLDDGRIKIVATIEDSRIAEDVTAGAPDVETRQLAVGAIVEPGVPLEVSRVEGIREMSGFVEIEAKVGR